MKIKSVGIVLLLLLIIASFKPTEKYLDTTIPINRRVNDLLSKMTLEEKVGQMVYNAPAIPRLNIPEYNWWNEGLHGVARNGLATSFPQGIGMSATWDKDLMHEVATAISDEARAKYNIAMRSGHSGWYQGLTFWSPNINIFRDPRWGRGMETYGEDPFLTGCMAVQFITGMQGNDPKYLKTIATAKHFAVHSGPEPDRHTFDANISEYDLRETYLPAFKMSVVDAHVGALMCAYNSLRGHACCSNDPLLNGILRHEWHFNGYVVSDCFAINDIYGSHQQAKDVNEASADAVKAGTDIECGDAFSHLNDALKNGLLSEAYIDTSVRRLFTARFKLGMFDPPDMVPYSNLDEKDIDSKEHKELAGKAACEAVVLLKNEKNILPLKKDIKTIAVIGPNANDVQMLLGNYNGFPSHTVTPLEGIRDKVSKQTTVLYAPGCEVGEGMPVMEIVSSKYLFTSTDMRKKGLKAEYFNNRHYEEQPATETDTVIDVMGWNKTKEDFSVRWTGYLVTPVAGKYRIGCWGGTDFKMYINDSLMVADNDNGNNDYSTVDLTFEKGRAYKIKVETVVNGPENPLQLLWSIPNDNREQEAMDAVKKADVVVMCMGLSPRLEGEDMPVQVPGFKGGDRVTMDLPATQENLLKKIAALGKPIVLVMLNGSAMTINWEQENIPGIVESWYGGEAAGSAIADVLFGDYNPGGRLPVTFYKSVDQLPAFNNYNMKGRTYRYFSGDVLYPFGYGLSYTKFSYSNLMVSGNMKDNQAVKVSVDVKNIGSQAGDEVVELYVKGKGVENNDAIKSLKGFERITLKADETRTVTFSITKEMLSSFKEGSGFITDKGEHTLLIGSSSADKDLKEVKVIVE